MKKTISMVLTMLLSFAVLAGCRENAPTVVPSNPGEGYYHVFYRNSTATALSEQSYRVAATEAIDIADELVGVLQQEGSSDEYVPAIPQEVSYLGCYADNDVLYLQFDSFANQMTTEERVLFEAALTRTLTQIPRFQYIAILTDGQPFMNEDGTPVGFLASSQFINVIGNHNNELVHGTFTLYFATEDGEELVSETFSATYSSAIPIEQHVANLLIEGPAYKGHYRTLPETTKVISTTTKDNICYINLEANFLTDDSDLKPELLIYSLVNSLTELPNVSSVQILINGSADNIFRKEIPLSEPLKRNLDLIKRADEE